jgi:hypothetical protein
MNTFTNRQLAIEKTLIIEALTSKLIKHLLGLDLDGKTRSLDNKSSSISLRSKIDLLTDAGKIDKVTYTNLLHIISIRNQFAHNFECNNFEDLSKFIDGIEKPLLQNCLTPTNLLEENLKEGFLKIFTQVFESLRSEFVGVTTEYQKNLSNLAIYISEAEEKLLNQYGIIGQRNRVIVLNIVRELMRDGSTSQQIENTILTLKKNNPA